MKNQVVQLSSMFIKVQTLQVFTGRIKNNKIHYTTNKLILKNFLIYFKIKFSLIQSHLVGSVFQNRTEWN